MRQVTTYSMDSDSSHGERIMVSLESDAASERSVSKSSEAQPGVEANSIEVKQT